MKIAVMGSGGVGGYFGGMLAKVGHPVTFIARGEHLQAIRKEGLRVVHNAGEFTVDASATDNAEGVGPAELVLFSVKAYDTDSALRVMSPLVGPDTTVLTLQNGVDSYAAVAKDVRRENTHFRGRPTWKAASTPPEWWYRRAAWRGWYSARRQVRRRIG